MATDTHTHGQSDEEKRRVAAQHTVAADPYATGQQVPTEDQKQAAEKAKRDNEEAQKKARERAAEMSDKMFEATQKALADKQEEAKKVRESVQQHREARQKEDERRASMSPAERMEEDEKIASMTPEEIAKRDEERGQVGFVSPEQMDQINLLASSYPTFAETAHAAEMILTEANGQRSRAYAYLADPVTIKIGQPLKQTVAPTSTTPGTFVPAAVGADCSAIAIYGGTSNPTNGLRIAVLVRDCEINGYQINWGAITVPEQAIGLATLATAGIIVRY